MGKPSYSAALNCLKKGAFRVEEGVVVLAIVSHKIAEEED